MKSAPKPKKDGPIEVRAGSVTVKIYRSKTRGRSLFTVAYRDTNDRRIRKNFADLETAKVEASAIATKIRNGQLDVLELTSRDRTAYQHALALLAPTEQPLELVAGQYAEAFRILNGAGSVVEAARFFARHHPVALPPKTLPQVYEEFLRAKESDNASKRYIEDIRSRLGRLAKRFTGRISEISGQELEEWLTSLGGSSVTRNSFRALIVTFFNFAKQRGYLPRQQPTEAERIPEAKEAPTAIGIFTPEEMERLLKAADAKHVPYLAIGAFAGLRHAELMRLEWENVKLEEGHIEVPAEKAKTAQRRIVPIQPNLKAWLSPFGKLSGKLFDRSGSRFLHSVTETARKLKINWPQNGLRHSYASYRLADCKNVAEVALEMGNSPQMVFRHYRELVTPRAAERWWKIAPADKDNTDSSAESS